jgi:hypothetical protein
LEFHDDLRYLHDEFDVVAEIASTDNAGVEGKIDSPSYTLVNDYIQQLERSNFSVSNIEIT